MHIERDDYINMNIVNRTVFCFVFISHYTDHYSSASRVWRRQPVAVFRYPFAAALSLSNVNPLIYAMNGTEQDADFGICSGVLISPRHILTAAHCLYSDPLWCSLRLNVSKRTPQRVHVFLQSMCNKGECNGTQHKVASIAVHPSYIACETDFSNDIMIKQEPNDIGMIELEEDVDISHVCMPDADSVIPGQKALESFGYGNGEGLHSMRHQFVQESEDTIFAYNIASDYGIIPGDSGGPLVQKTDGKYYLFGITSSKYHRILDDRNYLGLKFPIDGAYFTDVRKHLDWICDVTGVCSSSRPTNHQLQPSSTPPPADGFKLQPLLQSPPTPPSANLEPQPWPYSFNPISR